MKRNLSEEQKVMYLYEIILSIIGQNGPATIPSLCSQINQHPIYWQNREKPVQQAQIKSVLSKKKELFVLKNDKVSIKPERDLVSLNLEFGKCFSPWFKFKVDFVKNHFIYFEMNLDTSGKLKYEPFFAGSIEEFKQEIYRLKIWDWEENYEPDGIVLDGTSWTVVLKTKAKTFKSNGLELFPKEWTKFCKAITKLSGKKC